VAFEDRYVTATPEGVSLDVVLAGFGSRFIAFALDFLVQVVAYVLLLLLTFGVVLQHASGSSLLVARGVIALVTLLDFIGYFIVCELLFGGRTLGKRATGIRVVRVGGQPVGWWSSLLRNIFRLIDMMPGIVYFVGGILILSTKRNQRLGDLVGNTIVIRERVAAVTGQWGGAWADPSAYGAPAPQPAGAWGASFQQGAWLPPELAHWDVSAVPEQELVLARTFLTNRAGYDAVARDRLAGELANRIWPYVAGPTVPPHPEVFLDAVLRVKAARG
jgi:uncharacterized RDD family membrane protein YckC